jgi:hypothetical protein
MPLGHCQGCGRGWAGLAEAHCSACHLHFKSDSGFDRHRRDGRCLTPVELAMPRGKAQKPTLVPIERRGATYWVTAARIGDVQAQNGE